MTNGRTKGYDDAVRVVKVNFQVSSTIQTTEFKI
jgi:hypothetical protein